MEISSLNFMQPNFTARKEIIRRADDLVRHSRKNFPVLSNSYMDMFYNIRNYAFLSDKSKKADRLYNKVSERVGKVREHSDVYSENRSDGEYKALLGCIKDLKAGNCEECSDTLTATLAANGYYHSYKYDLALDVSIINKETGEVESSSRNQLDHTFVVTTLDKYPASEKNRVVADSWLGFADSISGAKEKYKKIYSDRIKEIILEKFLTLNNKETINPSDYEVRTKMVFCPSLRDAYDSIEEMGDYCKRKYKELVFNN